MEAWLRETQGVSSESIVLNNTIQPDLNQRLSVAHDDIPLLVKRFDSKGTKKSNLSEDRQMSRIMENLKVKGMGAFVPGPTEDSLEDYVDMLALIHKGSDVTSDVIKTYFLNSAMIAAETREKLSMVTDLDEMFDLLAKIQYPHPEYCQPLDVHNSMDTDRQLSVAKAV